MEASSIKLFEILLHHMNNQILILAELQEKLLDKYIKVNSPEMQICIKTLN